MSFFLSIYSGAKPGQIDKSTTDSNTYSRKYIVWHCPLCNTVPEISPILGNDLPVKSDCTFVGLKVNIHVPCCKGTGLSGKSEVQHDVAQSRISQQAKTIAVKVQCIMNCVVKQKNVWSRVWKTGKWRFEERCSSSETQKEMAQMLSKLLDISEPRHYLITSCNRAVINVYTEANSHSNIKLSTS